MSHQDPNKPNTLWKDLEPRTPCARLPAPGRMAGVSERTTPIIQDNHTRAGEARTPDRG